MKFLGQILLALFFVLIQTGWAWTQDRGSQNTYNSPMLLAQTTPTPAAPGTPALSEAEKKKQALDQTTNEMIKSGMWILLIVVVFIAGGWLVVRAKDKSLERLMGGK